MTPYKKLTVALGTLLVLLLAVMVILPAFLRGPIEERVKAGIGESVAAQVDWSRVRLSLLSDFPNLTVRLDDLSVTGVGAFDGDTLASVGRFAAVVDAGSVFRGLRSDEAIVVRAIDIDRPILRLTVLEDGSSNWDIAIDADDERAVEPGAGLNVSLRRLEIRDATILLDDRQAGVQASLIGYRQSLTGDFGRDSFVLGTSASADEASLRFAGIPYLNRVRLELDAEVDADLVNGRYTLRQNALRLNELALEFAGAVGVQDDLVELDLTFAAPSTDFRHILSLVPAIYAREFQTVQTTGTMSVSGSVGGSYGPDAFPSFALKAVVENGTFRYPDLPLPAREIRFDLAIDNPGGDVDNTVVRLERFNVVIGNDPISGGLVVRTPVSDPDVDLRLVGRLDLAELERTVKLDSVEELAGVLAADLSIHSRLSFVDTGQYDRITATGGAEIRGLTLLSETLPHAIAIDEAVLRLTPRHAELSEFRGRMGASDVRLVGQLDNLLGFAMRDEELRGDGEFRSTRFDLNEWRSDGDDLEVVPVPAKLDFVLRAGIDHLLFGDLEMSEVHGTVRIKDQRVDLEGLAMKLLGGDIAVSGFYETTDVRRPTFDANLRMTRLDIPAAVASLTTVRMLAPVARYAQGNFSADFGIRGALDEDMMPVFQLLNGHGSLETSRMLLHEFPAMASFANLLRMDQLRSPVLDGIRSYFEVRDGRLHVQPFGVTIGEYRMEVAGSNGIDQSLEYSLRLNLPRSALGTEANRAIASLASQAGRTGFDLQAAEVIELGARISGSVTDPSVHVEWGDAVGSVRAELDRAVRDEVDQRIDALERQVDATAEEARRVAEAERARLLGEAEERAALVLSEAETLAERVRSEGYVQADALLDRAGTPVARLAARPAADRLRRETDDRADQILREAETRAEEILADARRRAGEPEP
jgi:hypothetical protein